MCSVQVGTKPTYVFSNVFVSVYSYQYMQRCYYDDKWKLNIEVSIKYTCDIGAYWKAASQTVPGWRGECPS